MNSKALEGKAALITGASKGLGKAMALALAGVGTRLALVSRNVEQLNETAAAVRQLGAEAAVFQCDVTDEAVVQVKYQEMLDNEARERERLASQIRSRTKELLETNQTLLRVQKELLAYKKGLSV